MCRCKDFLYICVLMAIAVGSGLRLLSSSLYTYLPQVTLGPGPGAEGGALILPTVFA